MASALDSLTRGGAPLLRDTRRRRGRTDTLDGMTDNVFPDPDTPFGARVQRRLREDKAIWLTTVAADGTPQPSPVWFVFDGRSVLMYSLNTARRLSHIRRDPRVSLHLDGDRQGGDVIVLTGRADIVEGHPLAVDEPSYMEKYREDAVRISPDLQGFSEQYSVAVRITIDHVRGF
jgi:PPOX class probable F420-dependent enzyme